MAEYSPTQAQATPAYSAARTLLVAIWLAFLCWHVAFIFYLRWRELIEWDTVGSSLETVGALYAPAFAAMGLFYWKGGWRKESPSGAGLRLALASALFWNALLFVLTLMVLLRAAEIEDTYALSIRIGTIFIWLVAGSMSYAFAGKE